MGTLTALGAAYLLAASVPVVAAAAVPGEDSSIDRWSVHIGEASERFGIPREWIRRVMRAESGGRTSAGGRPITSRAGAMGLMQLMPGTWRDMREMHGLGADPHDPRDNILAGTAYLRAMYDRFGYPGLFAAYNAGPGRYADHLATGRRLPAETRAYLRKVANAPRAPAASGQVQAAGEAGAGASALFATDHASASAHSAPPAGTAPHPLFVRLSGTARSGR